MLGSALEERVINDQVHILVGENINEQSDQSKHGNKSIFRLFNI